MTSLTLTHSNEPKYRELVETETFAQQRDLIVSDIHRYDDIMHGLGWSLAKGAEEFPIAYGQLRVVKTNAFGDTPRLRIFFTVDDDAIQLRWIELLPLEDESFT